MRIIKTVVLAGIVLLATCAFATHTCTTCYIDFVSGSDANDGTTKTTGGGHGPWKHAPFMLPSTLSGNAATQVYAYGDSYIFKGGVVWPNAVMGMQIVLTASSTSTTPVGCSGTGCMYVGVDLTWYDSTACSGKGYPGFCRPVFDGGGSPVATYPGGIAITFLDVYGGGDNSGNGGYTIIDNLEFTGLGQTNNTGVPAYIAKRCGKHCEFKNLYFHGWSHSGTATQDNTRFVSGVSNCPQDTTSSFHDSVWDGADTTRDMGMALAGSVNYFYNNYIAYTRNGVLSATQWFYQNTLQHMNSSFDATSHGNVFEVTTGCSVHVWNNRIDDSTGGATLFLGPVGGGPADFTFNNLITNQQNQSIQVASNECGVSCTGTGEYIFNNAIQQTIGNSSAPIAGAGDAGGLFIPFMTINNNMLLQDSSNYIVWGRTTTQNQATNVTQSNSAATTAGYNQSSTFWYFPPNGSGETVGAGTNETTAICNLMTDPNLATPVEDCKSDSSYGVGYNATTHTVVVPGRTPNTRPASTAWDIGPYEFSVAPPPPAAAPTCTPGTSSYSGTASPVCSSTNTGTVVHCVTFNGTTPVSNGLGTGCTTGTALINGGHPVVSYTVPVTMKIIAGTSANTDSTVTSYTYTPTIGGPPFFGIDINTSSSFPTQASVATNCLRLWDTPGSTRPFIDVGGGVYTFTTFDTVLNLAHNAGVTCVQMPLARTPNYISSNTDLAVPGALTSGTFTAAETVRQTGSLVSATFRSFVAGSPATLNISQYSGTATAGGTWVGQSSGAIFTPSDFPDGCDYWVNGGTTPATLSGQCSPPTDLNANGSGTDLSFRNFVAVLASHVNAGGYSTNHAVPHIYEGWNEPERCQFWNSNTAPCTGAGTMNELGRMMWDAHCILTDMPGTNPYTGEPCHAVWAAVTALSVTAPLDPTAIVTAPSATPFGFTAILQNYLYCNQAPVPANCTIGGAAWADVLNYHLKYLNPSFSGSGGNGVASKTPEATADLWQSQIVGTLQSAELAKPLFSSEWGSATGSFADCSTATGTAPPFCNYTDPDMQTGYVSRTFAKQWDLGYPNAVWYNWPVGLPAAAALSYTQTAQWMAGGSNWTGCTKSAPGTTKTGLFTFTCPFTQASGASAALVWDNSQDCATGVCTTTTQTVPSIYGSYSDLNGNPAVAIIAHQVPIGIKPLLLQNSPVLTVAVIGPGSVTSSPAGISCPGTCTASFPLSTTVTLTGNTVIGYVFTGFAGGGCAAAPSNRYPCGVVMSGNQSVVGTFSNACGLPNLACSLTSLATMTYPSTPPISATLTGAGTLFTDPAFGTLGMVLTGPQTDPSLIGGANGSYNVANGGSSDDQWWSTDDHLTLLGSSSGFRYLLGINPVTMTINRPYSAVTSGCPTGNCSTRGGWATSSAVNFSQANGGQCKLYAWTGTAIQSYVFGSDVSPSNSCSTGISGPPAPSTIIQFIENLPAGCVGTACNGLPSDFGSAVWIGESSTTAGDAVIGAGYSSSAYHVGTCCAQGTGIYVVIYSPSKGVMSYNTSTGSIQADIGWAGGTGLTCTATQCSGTSTAAGNFTLHQVKLNYDGSRMYLQWTTCISGTCVADVPFVWITGTTTVYQSETLKTTGHFCAGALGLINDPGNPIWQWYYRTNPVTSPDGSPVAVNTLPSPNQPTSLDTHCGWQMGNALDTLPFYWASTTASLLSSGLIPFDQPTGPWWSEIDATETSGSGLTHRIGMTFNSGYANNFSSAQNILACSSDGLFCSFGSDMEQGIRNTGGTSTSCTPSGPIWLASKTYPTGYIIAPSLNNAAGNSFKATTGGTASSSQPNWGTSCTSTCTDGGVTWTNIGAATGANACASDVFVYSLGLPGHTVNAPTNLIILGTLDQLQ